MLPVGSVVGLEALQTAQAMKDSVCRWKSRVECTFLPGFMSESLHLRLGSPDLQSLYFPDVHIKEPG